MICRVLKTDADSRRFKAIVFKPKVKSYTQHKRQGLKAKETGFAGPSRTKTRPPVLKVMGFGVSPRPDSRGSRAWLSVVGGCRIRFLNNHALSSSLLLSYIFVVM